MMFYDIPYSGINLEIFDEQNFFKATDIKLV